MSDTRAFARKADGTETDITEGVEALYDLVISSMDWGSGFLTYDDALPVLTIAETFGFEDQARVRAYVTDKLHSKEQHEFVKARNLDARLVLDMPHDHVMSSAGQCMWPYCQEKAAATR